MPKRTRREKLLAQARRRTVTPVPLSSQDAPLNSPEQQHTFSFQVTQTPIQKDLSKETNAEELPIIQHDLIKTVILAICAIGIELTIYTLLRGK